MSLLTTFDADGQEIITPNQTTKKIDGFPETVISVFSQRFDNLITETLGLGQISYMSAGRAIPVYEFCYGSKTIGFYHTLLGGSASAALLEEIYAMGAKRVLFFGSCGSLDRSITSGHLIVPVAAYRDEGTSYHYAEASDFIEIESSEKLATIFDEINVPYIKTKTWTTDSFYRETEKNAANRKKDGC